MTTSLAPAVRRADASDLEAAERLLVSADLPVAGVAEAFDHDFVAETAGTVVGVAGLEVHGDDVEFREACPASAVAMILELEGDDA